VVLAHTSEGNDSPALAPESDPKKVPHSFQRTGDVPTTGSIRTEMKEAMIKITVERAANANLDSEVDEILKK
jgi:hypothetical protein